VAPRVRRILEALESGAFDPMELYSRSGGTWDAQRYEVHLDLVAGLLKAGLIETKDSDSGALARALFVLTPRGRAFLAAATGPGLERTVRDFIAKEEPRLRVSREMRTAALYVLAALGAAALFYGLAEFMVGSP